ncbi:MAG: hypothetical protein GY865_17065, partial [candidate division Zixibacteria bacterium]|nr:hypothetical protein [candidate division Zixibacteria bacterium]
MDTWKTNKKSVMVSTIIFVLLISLSVISNATDYDGWTTYTSTNEVRNVSFFNDSLQVVTSGGWLKIDPVTQGMNKQTNVDGLGTGDLYDILKDTNGSIWLAGFGRLIKYQNSEYSPYLFIDRNDKLMPLYDIEDDGDMLWVATTTGLALFSKTNNGGQIEDFYFRFGDLNPEPTVFDIEIVGDTIWLATSAGLAMADKSEPSFLKSSINWITFSSTQYSELAGDTVSALAHFDDLIYLGTNKNTYKLTIDAGDTSFTRIPTRDTTYVNSMTVTGDTLVIYTRKGFYIHTDSDTEWSSTWSIPSTDFFSGRFVNGVHWLGMATKGLYYGDNGSYEKLIDDGLPGNYVTVLTVNPEGIVAGGFQSRGVAQFNGNEWISAGIIGTIPNGVREGVRALSYDNDGNLWAGTWGNGAMFISPGGITKYDENNSTLIGILGAQSYIPVNSMVSSSNYLFMTNSEAYDGRSVSVVDLDDNSEWRYFDRNDNLTSNLPV